MLGAWFRKESGRRALSLVSNPGGEGENPVHSNPTRYTDGPTVNTSAPPAINTCPGAVSKRSVVWPVLAAQV